MSMQLRSNVRFNTIIDNLSVLTMKSNNEIKLKLDNYETLITIFKIINEHIVGLMNHFYNKKQHQNFAVEVIAKCDQLCEILNRMNNMDELMELMVMVKKKAVSHLKKILKKKETYLSPKTLEQIALLKL